MLVENENSEMKPGAGGGGGGGGGYCRTLSVNFAFVLTMMRFFKYNTCEPTMNFHALR